jgi:hypothetical protein
MLQHLTLEHELSRPRAKFLVGKLVDWRRDSAELLDRLHLMTRQRAAE